ncbi:ISAs1 family transposase [Telmatocola sphagniphila]|uniref:ISAs1 family transposase n=1 Tax=Telmatocola sphagniphila TaxID=1123043 RepID=A0A8E6B282_9BACT|nr:ISAs1 family transposase [Telmatocola sphagniphila]QVL30331.1 ISAs1 family transposase [Telmatocola sphagniphila]
MRRGFRSQRLGGRRSFRRDQDRLVPEVSPLPNGIPSHDTFGRVFRYLDTDAFEACFASWMAEICVGTDLLQVAIDGKTMRSSGGPGQKCLHVVSAFATANRVTLGQEAVDDKSNEITAIPELLKRLDIAGKIVTIDAMGCQKNRRGGAGTGRGLPVGGEGQSTDSLGRDQGSLLQAFGVRIRRCTDDVLRIDGEESRPSGVPFVPRVFGRQFLIDEGRLERLEDGGRGGDRPPRKPQERERNPLLYLQPSVGRSGVGESGPGTLDDRE